MTYLDNAATTNPKPGQVIAAMSGACRYYSANPGRSGHVLSEKCSEMVYRCRQKVSDFFDGPGADRVVFTSGCTLSVNMAIQGMLEPGDHIIMSNLEHNAVARPVYAMAARGIRYDIASVSEDPIQTVKNFEDKINSKTKAFVFLHASNVIGRILPLKELCRLADAYGIRVIVDAAQTAGILPISMNETGIDCLCVAPHKGLYGPMGTGILVVKGDLNPLVFGGTGSLSSSMEQPDFLPDRLESGTINVPGIAGISAGIDFINQKGLSIVYRHEMKFIIRLYDALEKHPNIELYTERPEPGAFAPVLSFNIKGKTSEEVSAELNKSDIYVRAGLHCAPLAHSAVGTLSTGTVRICPSVFSTEADFQKVLNKILKIAK